MSSTNRGAVRERDDFYETPAWATDLIIPIVGPPEDTLKGKRVLDPFAGRGAILNVCKTWNAQTLGMEIDPGRHIHCATAGSVCGTGGGYHACGLGDAFKAGLPACDLIITNPPFSRAREAAELCIRQAPVVAMLLRLAFLESAERVDFHRKHPADVHVLARRPSFLTPEQKKRMHEESLERWRVELEAWQRSRVGEEPKRPSPPGTDSAAYAWFCWGLGGGKWSVLG
jgi:predicted RNA methylase